MDRKSMIACIVMASLFAAAMFAGPTASTAQVRIPKAEKEKIAQCVAPCKDDAACVRSCIPQKRWPMDAAKCLLECARGCNGSVLCVSGCMAECSTIILY
ncbi:MAG TPA: hypothetical protein VMX97_09630 [Hyphomicrobiaceae bacterium]|nr:hypothetical protein [Hyphomicrobiaceae bacterium]